jgi:hypothetical protein
VHLWSHLEDALRHLIGSYKSLRAGVNLKIAKQISLTIPPKGPNVLARLDKVIKNDFWTYWTALGLN